MKDFFMSLLELVYPRICSGCGNPLLEFEETLCLQCISKLPKTNFHLSEENAVLQLFEGRFPVTRATAFLFFRKHSLVQQLIYQLKYKGAKETGEKLGKLFGENLKGSRFINDIDILMPVPLHPAKQQVRGYNQSEVIGKGMESSLNIPLVTENLVRKVFTNSQTRKSMFERWKNVSGVFAVKHPGTLSGKHILLIDDVITTGSTLEGCMLALKEVPDVRISVAVLAKPDS